MAEHDTKVTVARATELELAGLPALLMRPRGARALYVLAHGAGAGMRHELLTSLADLFAARAIATLRWEFPYMAAGKKLPDRPAVAEAAVARLWATARARFAALPMFAGGRSFGGRMTSQAHAAQPLDGLAGLIFLGFPLHPTGDPAKSATRAAHLADAAGPMLFVQGSADELAERGRMKRVIAALGARATLYEIDGGDHAFAVRGRAGERAHVLAGVADAVATWIARSGV
jgi:hypothetical protein